MELAWWIRLALASGLYLGATLPVIAQDAAKKQWFWAYLPDGTELKGPFIQIKDVLDTLGLNEHYIHSCDNPSGQVYFQSLTRTPKVVVIIERPMPEKIPSMINSFDARTYFYSYSYYSDVMDMVKRRTLTHDYIRRHMPAPDTIEVWPDGRAVRLRFKDQNLLFTIAHNNLISNIEIIDFASIEKYKLALTDKKVIGTDRAIGFSASIYNHSRKTIKYVHFHVTAFNRVDDLIRSTVAKCIGPIEPERTASVEFPNLIYSSTAVRLQFDKVVVTYMDGTKTTVPGNAIERITLLDWEEVGQRH
jgi:hypothetical protein